MIVRGIPRSQPACARCSHWRFGDLQRHEGPRWSPDSRRRLWPRLRIHALVL